MGTTEKCEIERERTMETRERTMGNREKCGIESNRYYRDKWEIYRNVE